jgi:hypothetical protein
VRKLTLVVKREIRFFNGHQHRADTASNAQTAAMIDVGCNKWTLSNYVKMIINLTAELLEKIKITEKEKDRHKILRIQPIIKTTNEIASSKRHKRKLIPNPLVVKRNLKLHIILSSVLWVTISIPFIYVIVNNKSWNFIGNIFAVTMVLLMFFALFGNLMLKKLILPIVLSDNQIEISGETYQWNSIENTFFVFRPGRTSSFVL